MTDNEDSRDSNEKRMKLRYAGVCRACGTDLPAKADAVYERPTKTVRCLECPSEVEVAATLTQVEVKVEVEPVAAE